MMTKPLRDTGLQILMEAMESCSVAHAFASKVRVTDPHVLELEGYGEIDLSSTRRVLIVAMGKGAASMLEALFLQRAVVEGREVQGILIAPKRPANLPHGISFYEGGHPFPNEQSFAAAQAVLKLLISAAHDPKAAETFCFFLISGGASAMMELPLDPAISLEDTVQFHRALVHSGASITEINCVRKHFSAVKGGRLALAADALRSLTIVVSDVPSGQLDALASGPTMPDSTTVEQCRSILEKYSLLPQFPEAVRRFFSSSQLKESPKAGEIVAQVYSLLSSDDLAAAAREGAERRGFKVFVDNTCDDWEYRAAADYLLQRLDSLRQQHGRVCLISSGEVTVRLPVAGEMENKKNGVGGRNLHFALYSALQLQPPDRIAVLSAGSDGVDGNSPAAGAVVDASTVLDRYDEAKKALDDFDSYPFLNEMGAAIVTGPTGNNLRDLRILLADTD
jgi:hydroxypyruvate reductase